VLQFVQTFATTVKKIRKTPVSKQPTVGLVGLEVNEHPSSVQRQERNVARMQRVQMKMDELHYGGLSGGERFKNLQREMFIREGK